MAGLTDYTASRVLEWLVGKTAMPSLPSAYLGLFTVFGDDDGTGFTECSGNGYARVLTAGADWNVASGTSPSSISNANTIQFPTSTGGGWGIAIGWGIFDAPSSGNLLFSDYLGLYDWLEFSCTLATPGVLTIPGHGYSNGNSVVVDEEFGGVSLPTTAGSWSGVLTVANSTTNTITVGVNTTSVGGGMIRRMISQSIPGGAVFEFTSNNILILAA